MNYKIYFTHVGLTLWLLDLEDNGKGSWTTNPDLALVFSSEYQATLMCDILTDSTPKYTYRTTYEASEF